MSNFFANYAGIALSVLAITPVVGFAQAPMPETTERSMLFEPLVLVREWEEGQCKIKTPNSENFVDAKNNKAYPYGSIFNFEGSGRMRVYFGQASYLKITAPAEFKVINYDNRKKIGFEVVTGTYEIFVEKQATPGTFIIKTPVGDFTELTGQSSLTVRPRKSVSLNTDEDDLLFRTGSGTAAFHGLHYTIPVLKPSNGFSCANTPDFTQTRITGISGDYTVDLPNGIPENPITKFNLGASAVIKIRRARAVVGNKWCVSVLTLLPSGTAKNAFSYVEDSLPELSTGDLIDELLPPPVDETSGTEEGGAAGDDVNAELGDDIDSI